MRLVVKIIVLLLQLNLISLGRDLPVNHLNFKHISTQMGISSNSIYSICQDKIGFLWFGTPYGLCRYDGYSFKNYTHNPNDDKSISDNIIYTIFEDKRENLWVGTNYGLNLFNRENGTFTRFLNRSNDLHSISNNIIYAITEDTSGMIWIGTNDGLNRYNPEKLNFKRYQETHNQGNNKGGNHISSLLGSSSRALWAGFNNGDLKKYDQKTDSFQIYPLKFNRGKSRGRIINLYEDETEILWISTSWGLLRVNQKNGETKHFYANHEEKNSIVSNTVFCTQKYGGNVLWIGTIAGLNLLECTTSKIDLHRYNSNVPGSISQNDIRSVYVDRSRNLWLGTLGGGLNMINRRLMDITYFSEGDDPTINLNNKLVWAVIKDAQGNLWVGTDRGLNKYDSKAGKFTYYTHSQKNESSPSSNIIINFCYDKEWGMWIGTYAGLNLFNQKSGNIQRFDKNQKFPKEVCTRPIYSIYKDGRGTVWVGLSAGLYSFDSSTFNFTSYHHQSGNIKSISSDVVTSITGDGLNTIYIGTVNGVNIFNILEREFKRVPLDIDSKEQKNRTRVDYLFLEKDDKLWIGTNMGLKILDLKTYLLSQIVVDDEESMISVRGIIKDHGGTIWITSNRGIFNYNLEKKSLHRYPLDSGSRRMDFNRSAIFLDRDGYIYAGNPGGLLKFYPSRLPACSNPPDVVITKFELFNKEVNVASNSVLSKDISLTDEIILKHYQNYFSFEFSVLDYSMPEENKYKYKLNPIDPDWVTTDFKNRTVTYTNLNPGNYTFSVKGANCDGIWNELEKSIKIRILPPFWQTWWFKILLIICILFIAIFVHLTRMKRLARRLDSRFRLEKFFIRYKISKREQEILKLILNGKTRKEIEDLLYISDHTVKNHTYNIYKKLGIKNKGQLISLFKSSDHLFED